MKDRIIFTLRRVAAWITCLLVILLQLSLPAYALTQEEIDAMPTVTVYYQTAEGVDATAMMATPTSDTLGKAFWATLPAEAFAFPITLSVLANPNTTYTFTPPDGSTINGDPNATDYSGQSTPITAYQDGVALEEYRLYLSAQAMPVEVPPAIVQVFYVDAEDPNNVLYTENFTAYYNTDNVVTANVANVPEGYTLEGDDGAFITVDELGNANPATVTFTFRKAQVVTQGQVTVYYTDVGGNELANPQSFMLDPGTYPITPDWNIVPAGYILSEGTAAQVDVTVSEDGTTSPEAVTFEFVEEQTSTPTVEPTVEPTAEPTAQATAEPTAEPDTPTAEPATASPTPEVTAAPEMVPLGRYAQTNAVANFRTETSTTSKKAFADVRIGAYVWVYGTLDVTDGDGVRTWAVISYEGTDCYVWNSLIDTLSQEDSDAYNYAQPSAVPGTETSAPPITATPTATEVTPSPTPTETPLPAQVTGYFMTVADAPLAAGPGSDTLIATVAAYTVVYVEGQNYLDNLAWHKTTVQSNSGYIASTYLRQLNEAEVEAYLTTPNLTPTPTATATATAVATDTAIVAPTATATITFTPTDTPAPTATASPTVTPTNSPTPEPDMYVGYGITTTQTALRNNATLEDSSIMATLPASTLLYLNGQRTVNNIVWSSAQTVLGTSIIGIAQDGVIKRITPAEAQVYIDAYNEEHATATPSPSPTPTATPAQLTGYYITLGNVPLRDITSTNANINLWLAKDTVVRVSGQLYNEGYGWHITTYGSSTGYVRADQLRKLSDAEVKAYEASLATPTPTPASTVKPYDPYADSSYGFVSASSVNFRATPSTNGAKIKTLKQYAFALILGTKVVDGTTWYNLNQSGTIGWVSGAYFDVLNLTELSSFLNSSEYLKGLTNNSTSTTTTTSNSGTSTTSSGTATQGQVSSVEDWNLGVWQNPSSSANASYEPFNPYATPTAPLTSTTPTVTPTASFVVGTMIPIPYEDESTETQTGSSWVGLLLGGVVLLGGAGGVYAYALNQNKKRRLAARNAANVRRASTTNGAANAATGAAAGTTAANSPYTRRAVAAPPVSGATQRPDGTTPSATGNVAGSATRANPYARPASGGVNSAYTGANTNPYARPASETAPYGKPVEPTVDPLTGNPYATRTGATPTVGASTSPYAPSKEGGTGASPANPYATTQDDATAPTNPTPRRTSRTSRHQGSDNDQDT